MSNKLGISRSDLEFRSVDRPRLATLATSLPEVPRFKVWSNSSIKK